MITISLTYDTKDKDIGFEVELQKEDISLDNLFVAFEQCLLGYGFTEEDISNYYIGQYTINQAN